MNYEPIRYEYETTKISFRKLAEKYGVNYKKIERLAKSEEWNKYDSEVGYIPDDMTTNLLASSIKKEVKDLDKYLKTIVKTPLDKILAESYLNSYKLFSLISSGISYEDMDKNETIRMQQLQIERNNLMKLGKEVREMSWRNSRG